MLLSMTGFGKAIVELPNKKITVEIKSLNSKQLDLSLRVSPLLREKEMELRNLIARRVERGKVEAAVYIENHQAEASMQFNIPILKAYKQQIEDMASELGISVPEDWYSVLLRFPETLKTDNPTTGSNEDYDAALQAMDKAIDALTDYRKAEGAKLEEFFASRIDHIRDYLGDVPRYETERIDQIGRASCRERV